MHINFKRTMGPNFLLVGLERSGTQWISNLLNGHKEVACIPLTALYGWQEKYKQEFFGEVHFFNTVGSLEPGTEDKFSRPLDNFLERNNKFFADLVPLKNKVPKEELYQKFIERYNKLCDMHRGSKKIVGESSPAYIFYLDFIDSFYPGIKKICIIRDPRDRVVSWHFNQLGKKRKIEKVITDDFINDYFNKRIKKEYESMLAYKGRIHCLTYEQLSNNTKEIVKKILDYLKISYNEEIIKYMINEASFNKVSQQDNDGSHREKGQELITSHYRKGIVGDWHNYLTKKQAFVSKSILGDLQRQVFIKYNIT